MSETRFDRWRDKLTLPGGAVLMFEPGSIDVAQLLEALGSMRPSYLWPDPIREAFDHQREKASLRAAIEHSEEAIRRLRDALRDAREDRMAYVKRDTLDIALIYLEGAVNEWKERIKA